MTALLIALVIVLAVAVIVLASLLFGRPHRRFRPVAIAGRTRRILFPFVASSLSQGALDAALRLSQAEEAVLVPVFLARVPLHLPLDAPLPRQAALCLPMQETIEQRAAAFGVPVDARVERGRSLRHALQMTIDHEHFDRIVIAAATPGGHGFGPEDVAWLLAHAEGEIVVLRPGDEDPLPVAKPSRNGFRLPGRRADGDAGGPADERARRSGAAPVSSRGGSSRA